MGYFDDIPNISGTATATKPKPKSKGFFDDIPNVSQSKPIQKFQAPNGGTQIAPNKFKTPSGSTWEYLEDGTRKVSLATQFGGGSYFINPDKPNEIINKGHTNYGGVKEKKGFQRDDIVPVSLGGDNTSRTNIRQVQTKENPAKLETKIASEVKSGQKTLGQGRLEAMTYKQDKFGQPKQGFFDKIVDIAKSVLPKKKEPKQVFEVGEGQSPEQARLAKQVVRQPVQSNPQTPMNMDLKKGVLDLVRLPLRALVATTNPTEKLEPLEQKYPKLFRTIYGDEPIEGVSRKAVDYQSSLEEQGFGKWSKPLAVIAATAEASLDLAPLYVPVVKAINSELANLAKTSGTKQIQLTYKDLQDITSGKVTSGEKFDAFKAVSGEVQTPKQLVNESILATQDTLLQRATGNIRDIAKEIPTTYSLQGTQPQTAREVAQLFLKGEAKPTEIKPTEVLSEKPVIVETKPLANIEKPLVTTPSKPIIETGKTSGLARSIETKAIETGLTKKFSKLAEYNPITIKDQAIRASQALSNIDEARAIIRGEQPLPEGLKGTSLVTAMEEQLRIKPDTDLAYELANSPLLIEVSKAAQELRLAAERLPDSATAKLAEIRKAREAKAQKTVKDLGKTRIAVKKSAKEATQKVNLTKEELSWDKFLADIQC